MVLEAKRSAVAGSSPAQGAPPTPVFRLLGHVGYIAEGLIYVLVGAFALAAAVDPAQQPNGTQGAIAKLDRAPFGDALLALLALGLAAFVLWQCILAIVDPEHREARRSRTRRFIRIGHLFNAALHAVLVGEVIFRILKLGGHPDDGRSQALWTARAMSLPLGRPVIALTGFGIALFAVFQGYRALTRGKIKRVDLSRTRLRTPLMVLGSIGFAARGVLFGLIGLFLMDAARRYNAQHATGIAGALKTLKGQPDGRWLLGAVAVGLICYGLFQIAKEPYRNFRAT